MKNIKLLVVAGLLLQVATSFARNYAADEADNILDCINSSTNNAASDWVPSGPTAEDIKAATQVKNLAGKGSCEEAMINAAKNGDQKKIAILIAEGGVDLEAKDDQDRTALMRAAEKGYVEIVRILLDAGARVDTKDTFGWTALFIATDKNQVEVVQLLVARGAARLQETFQDLFVSAVFKGNAPMVQALAGDGAHVSCDIVNEASWMVNPRNAQMVAIIQHLQSRCNNSQSDDSEIND